MPESSAERSKLFHNAEETTKPETVTVTGTVPDWLPKGSLIRVGPGKWDLGEMTMAHMLDGYAIISKFTLDGSNVTLEKKYLESDAYKRANQAGKNVINEFGTRAHSDSSKSLFSRMVSSLVPEMSDNTYSTPFLFNSEVFLGADSGFIRSVNPANLSSPERHDAKCLGCNSLCAHPLRDENGDLWNLGMSLTSSLKCNLVKIPGSVGSSKDAVKKAKTICTFPTRRNGMLGSSHSFAMTARYIVVCEQPYYLSMSKIMASVVKGDTVKDWFEWRPLDKNRFYVFDKTTGKVSKTEFMSSEAFYFMHFINCYEENGQLIVDINCYDSPNVLDTLILAKLRQGIFEDCDQPYAQRFVLPLVEPKDVSEDVNLVTVKSSAEAVRRGSQIHLTPELLSDKKGAELPTLHPRHYGKKYTFYYMAGTFNPSIYSHAIVKLNVDKKETLVWKEEESYYPSEPYFLPNPNGLEEDDGVIVSAVTDARPGSQDFIIYLNAKTLEELGRAYFTSFIPTGLHSVFVPVA